MAVLPGRRLIVLRPPSASPFRSGYETTVALGGAVLNVIDLFGEAKLLARNGCSARSAPDRSSAPQCFSFPIWLRDDRRVGRRGPECNRSLRRGETPCPQWLFCQVGA